MSQDIKTCNWCRGRGSIPIEKGSTTSYPCPDCDGTGQLEEDSEGKWSAPKRSGAQYDEEKQI